MLTMLKRRSCLPLSGLRSAACTQDGLPLLAKRTGKLPSAMGLASIRCDVGEGMRAPVRETPKEMG